MMVVVTVVLLSIIELCYFRIANRFNIIDKPNARSLHTEITIRGGGIIFLISILLHFVYSGFKYPFFFLGLSAVTTISFLDDIFTLPNRYRLPFQFLAIILIFFELDFFSNPLWVCVLVMGVGIINAYNFMDGINGITGGYSTVVIGALCWVNNYHIKFMNNDFFVFILLGLTVFNFFNFRTRAKCFAGDVGSISIAVITLFLLLKLMIQDNNPIYILFLSVYGVDSVLTIVHRLILKENIFKAHRLHLFQVLVHSLKVPHLLMASIYILLQVFVCGAIIININQSMVIQWTIGFGIIVLLSTGYVSIKRKVMN